MSYLKILSLFVFYTSIQIINGAEAPVVLAGLSDSEVVGMIQTNSNAFERECIQFPIRTNTIEAIIERAGDSRDSCIQKIGQQAKNVHPIIHGDVILLIKEFLKFKRVNGSEKEKALYVRITLKEFIKRLLTNRPLSFYGQHDVFLLRQKDNGNPMEGKRNTDNTMQQSFINTKKILYDFIHIGTETEKEPLTIQNYLSYDEMQISALLGVATPTFFINNGHLLNSGIVHNPTQDRLRGYVDHNTLATSRARVSSQNHNESDGVYVGIVGPRFERPGLMEYQHMVITQEQNTAKNGYGLSKRKSVSLLSLWEDFYGLTFPTYEEAQEDKTDRFKKLSVIDRFSTTPLDIIYFDTAVYKKRITLSLLPFLLYADTLGKKSDKNVYCRVVGTYSNILNIDGTWIQDEDLQIDLMLHVYNEILETHTLSNISDIEFLDIGKSNGRIGETENNNTYNKNGNNIKISFTQGNPADQLTDGNVDKLLVAMYRWDANSYPGNEYWFKRITSSISSAAACCSTIQQLQNPLINPFVTENIILQYGCQQQQEINNEPEEAGDGINEMMIPRSDDEEEEAVHELAKSDRPGEAGGLKDSKDSIKKAEEEGSTPDASTKKYTSEKDQTNASFFSKNIGIFGAIGSIGVGIYLYTKGYFDNLFDNAKSFLTQTVPNFFSVYKITN